ncbi:MAG: DUF488 domain-containing protein [Pseudomonadota bacterium]
MLATIGYERAEIDDFIATLGACDIDVLVDIRDRAQSRRPGFSKSALSNALAEAGIEYLHYKELGDPKEGRDAARRGDYDAFRQIFSAVMASDAAKKALNDLKKLASSQSICLMCFERDQLQCHRKIVSEYLEASLSVKARHLGVSKDASRKGAARRVRYLDQGAAASF